MEPAPAIWVQNGGPSTTKRTYGQFVDSALRRCCASIPVIYIRTYVCEIRGQGMSHMPSLPIRASGARRLTMLAEQHTLIPTVIWLQGVQASLWIKCRCLSGLVSEIIRTKAVRISFKAKTKTVHNWAKQIVLVIGLYFASDTEGPGSSRVRRSFDNGLGNSD
jgi:hypothetical protein